MADRELDARGVMCPRPIVRAKQALGEMSRGQILCVLATDPGAAADFHAFAQQSGNELVETVEINGEVRILIKRV